MLQTEPLGAQRLPLREELFVVNDQQALVQDRAEETQHFWVRHFHQRAGPRDELEEHQQEVRSVAHVPLQLTEVGRVLAAQSLAQTHYLADEECLLLQVAGGHGDLQLGQLDAQTALLGHLDGLCIQSALRLRDQLLQMHRTQRERSQLAVAAVCQLALIHQLKGPV